MATEKIESVTLTQTERVVVSTDQGKVIVTGMVGPKSYNSISEAYDVDVSSLVDGATLIYSTAASKWQASTNLEKQVVEGGEF